MTTYTKEENVQIIKWYFVGNSVSRICQLFTEAFENSPVPESSTISRIISRFEECGCVTDCKKCSDIFTGQTQKSDDQEIRRTSKDTGKRKGGGRSRGSKTEPDKRIKKNQLLSNESDCQSEISDTAENIGIYSTLKTEEDYQAQEMKIEDIKIQYQYHDINEQFVDQKLCVVKSESDNCIENSECKKEEPCFAEIGDFSSSFQPEILDTSGNLQLFSNIKTEGVDDTQEVKIEDIKISH